MLYKTSEQGHSYNDKLDARAGRFAVSLTTVEYYNYEMANRKELTPVLCKPANQTFSEYSLMNEDDFDYGVNAYGTYCFHEENQLVL